jgi:hypothetical protein
MHRRILRVVAILIVVPIMACDGDSTGPVPVGPEVANISAGGAHTCALTSAGRLYCWGFNQYGQVGDATTTNRTTPVLIQSDHSFGQVSAGVHHTCALTSAGQLYCWPTAAAWLRRDNFTVGGRTAMPASAPGFLILILYSRRGRCSSRVTTVSSR